MEERKRTLHELMQLLQNVLVRVGVHRTPTGRKLATTNQQMTVLAAVLRERGCTVGDVAKHTYLPLPTVSRSLRVLERSGLLKRRRERKDQRVVRLHATDAGCEALEQIHLEAAKMLERLLARMSEREQTTVLLGLSILVDALGSLDAQDILGERDGPVA